MAERLQKFLARAGVASRRHAEELITAGRVAVNNVTVRELGTKVDPAHDLVTLDGQLVQPAEERAYFIFYKPAGVVTTMEDPQGRTTVAEYMKGVGRRVFPVGRLDFDTEGALLFTDDGELAHALTHPSHEVPRTYLAKVKGTPAPEALARLLEGVRLEDGTAKALEAEIFEAAERNTWIRITVGEGRQHLVKRLCAAIGHPVLRLYRPAHAGVGVGGLKPGELRPLTSEEVERVKAIAGGAAAPVDVLSLPPRRHGRGAPGSAEEDDEGGERLPPRDGAPQRRRAGAGDRTPTRGRSFAGKSERESDRRGGGRTSVRLGDRRGRDFAGERGSRSGAGGRGRDGLGGGGGGHFGERGPRSGAGVRRERVGGGGGGFGSERGGRAGAMERGGERFGDRRRRDFGERGSRSGAGGRGREGFGERRGGDFGGERGTRPGATHRGGERFGDRGGGDFGGERGTRPGATHRGGERFGDRGGGDVGGERGTRPGATHRGGERFGDRRRREVGERGSRSGAGGRGREAFGERRGGDFGGERGTRPGATHRGGGRFGDRRPRGAGGERGGAGTRGQGTRKGRFGTLPKRGGRPGGRGDGRGPGRRGR